MLIWCFPDVTADRVLFNVLSTAWIYVGARLEEQDLMHDFGAEYAAYRKNVAMLVPWVAVF